jgi:hypothetical protein
VGVCTGPNEEKQKRKKENKIKEISLSLSLSFSPERYRELSISNRSMPRKTLKFCIKPEALILLANFHAIIGFESQLQPRSRMITSNSGGSSRPSAKKTMKRTMFMMIDL